MIRCRKGIVVYSRVKPLMEMLFWNIQSVEQLHRNLIRWLDGEIPEDERIRSIERLNFQRRWVRIRTDRDVREMMFRPTEIHLIVVIS